MTLRQEQELEDKWFDAEVIPLVFYQDDGDSRYVHIWRTVSTFQACYNKNLKPVLDGEVDEIDLEDPNMVDTVSKS